GAAQHLADLVLQDLGVEQLLRVFPLVERLGLVESFVALEPDQLVAERLRHHLGELRLPYPGRSLDEDRLLQVAGEIHAGADGAARDVLELPEPLDDAFDGREHAGPRAHPARRASADATTRSTPTK